MANSKPVFLIKELCGPALLPPPTEPWTSHVIGINSLVIACEVTGRLTSEGSGVGGATITFQTNYIGFYVGPRLSNAVTHSDGTYSETMVTKAINSATGGTKPAPIRVLAGYSGDVSHIRCTSLEETASQKPAIAEDAFQKYMKLRKRGED